MRVCVAAQRRLQETVELTAGSERDRDREREREKMRCFGMCAVHVVYEYISTSVAAAPNGLFIRALFLSFFLLFFCLRGVWTEFRLT